jgi:hypothetical protein
MAAPARLGGLKSWLLSPGHPMPPNMGVTKSNRFRFGLPIAHITVNNCAI